MRPAGATSLSRSLAVTTGILVGVVGCQDNADSPTGPQESASPTLAVAAAAAPLLFRAVSAGESHTCGVTTDSRAFCWGSNFLGKLGTGSEISRLVPAPVLGGLRFRNVSAGGIHTAG